MKRTTKKRLFELPVLGYGLRVFYHNLHAPSQYDLLHSELGDVSQSIEQLQDVTRNLTSQTTDFSDKLSNINKSQDSVQQQFMLLERSLSEANSISKKGKDKEDANKDSDLFAEDHLLDIFYTNFEDRFRGDEGMITERLKEYLPDFKGSKVQFKKHPVLDIGTGRGEFLQLLKKNRIRGVGIDINVDMVERSKTKGLDVLLGDAVEYLQETKPQTFGAITGFHIVEHIPFNVLLRLFLAAHSALAEDGFVIFETPNPENIIVASCGFYMDPSHLHPLPPDLLAFALETCGFQKVEIRRIHPVEHKDAGKVPDEFINRFYGPRDYAVIGYK